MAEFDKNEREFLMAEIAALRESLRQAQAENVRVMRDNAQLRDDAMKYRQMIRARIESAELKAAGPAVPGEGT